jgi:hypothetical protein
VLLPGNHRGGLKRPGRQTPRPRSRGVRGPPARDFEGPGPGNRRPLLPRCGLSLELFGGETDKPRRVWPM